MANGFMRGGYWTPRDLYVIIRRRDGNGLIWMVQNFFSKYNLIYRETDELLFKEPEFWIWNKINWQFLIFFIYDFSCNFFENFFFKNSQ